MDRRTFIVLATLSAFAPAGCNANSGNTASNSGNTASTPGSSAATSASPAADGFQAVGEASAVQNAGDALEVTVANKPAMVVRDPASQNLVAVSRVCTHAGCSVNWQKEAQKFVCPCHNAEYSATGAVLQGPANQPLQSYTVKEEGGSVLVQG